MLTQNDEVIKAGNKSYPVGRQLLIRTEALIGSSRNYLPIALALLLILIALWGYRGGQALKLGPPLGEINSRDFQNIIQASQELKVGASLYTPALTFLPSANFKEFVTGDTTFYAYPPLAALLARPFLWVQTGTALELWSGINLVLLVGSALIAARIFATTSLVDNLKRFFFIMVLFYLYYPIQFVLKIGQQDILMLFLLLLTYFLYSTGNRLAGIPLAVAIAIKPIFCPILIFFVWKREWGVVVGAVAAAAILTVLGFSLSGWSQLADYLEVNRLWTNGPFMDIPVNQSVRSFALRAFTENSYITPLLLMPWLAYLVPMLVGLLAVAGWLVTVRRANNRKEPITMAEYGLTLTTLMLISPVIEDNHFVWLLVPFAAMLLSTVDKLHNLRNVVFLGICFLIALYLGYPAVEDKIYSGYETLLNQNVLVDQSKIFYTGAYLYGLIALQICMVIYLRLSRTGSAAASK